MKTPRLGSRLPRLVSLGACALLSCITPAHAWWDGDWTIRKKITIDTTTKGVPIGEPIGTKAMLIRLHDGNFQFAAAKEDGSDIRFVSEDDKTVLTHHIEKFDSLLSEAFVWVKLPDLAPDKQQSFWLYYGNAGTKAVKVDDPRATYDANTALVYHFAEKGAPPADSTTNGNTAQNAGTPVEGAMIGSGVRLDGKNAIVIPASPSLAWTDGVMTWSAWIKPTALAPTGVIFSRRDGGNGIVIGADNGVPFFEISDASGTRRSAAGEPLVVNTWRHLAVVAGAGTINLYLDGEAYGTVAGSIPALNTPALLGGDGTPGAPEVAAASFIGEIDELQISKAARPLGFIKLAAATEGGANASKALAFAPDEQSHGWFSGGGTMSVLLGSLTVDGWIVIVILMIMGVVSWWLMYSKIRYLNGISKGNAAFMREWKHVANDLTALDDADSQHLSTLGGRMNGDSHKVMRNSSVYRIYHIGVEEIRHRIEADNAAEGTRKGLAGRSIQAIRASLDGGLVRETQKLNRLIVLLTICISGGPFLGLLGTVVGVMITFAAIAAAGDVNVNAIAPGIAAALLATVAGLAVAIPALFGYNYIVSRVKDAKDDMAIFIDEFVTKMAEFYTDTPQVYRGQPQKAPAERSLGAA